MRGIRRALTLGVAVILVAVLAFQFATWPDVAALAVDDPQSTAFMERYQDRHPAAGLEWIWVPYERISDELKRAVLVAEDIGFFDHEGFAVEEIKAAVRQSFEEGRPPRGASTLSQQLVKNLWLSPSRNPWRKVKEALLTAELERELSKRRILEVYLNVVEFGPGIYGAEAAARHYFGRSATRLNERQAAELAAALPRPATWHPGSSADGYSSQVDRVLRRMRNAGWIEALL